MKSKYWLGVIAVLLLAGIFLFRRESSQNGLAADSTPVGEEGGQPAGAASEAGSAAAEGSRKDSGPALFSDRLGERAGLRRQSYLTAASLLVGQTVDPDGQGISGVRLELTGSASAEVTSESLYGQTVSGGEGEFRLDLPDSFGGWLRASKDGYAPVRQPIWSAGPGELRRVVVLDPKTAPLRVVVNEVFSRLRVPWARVQAELTSPEPADEVTHFECFTDDSGECLLSDLPALRRMRVMASKRGHFEDVKLIMPGVVSELLPLTIIAGPTLVLLVQNTDGEPIGGASVRRPDGLLATTDASGRVWMPVIDELSSAQVMVSASGYRSRQTLIDNDGTEQVVELEPAPILRGVVVTPERTPLPGVHISIRKRIRGDARPPGTIDVAGLSEGLQEQTLTETDGYFEIPVPDERSGTSLVAHRQGFQDWGILLGDEDNPLPDPLEIILRPYASVVLGQTFDPSGVPISAQVFLTLVEPASEYLKRETAVAFGGFYLIGNLTPGRYLVEAHTVVWDRNEHYQSPDYSIEVADGGRFQQDIHMQRVAPQEVTGGRSRRRQ